MTDRTLADSPIPFDLISFGLMVLIWCAGAGALYAIIRYRHQLAAAITGAVVWCAVTLVDKIDRWIQTRMDKTMKTLLVIGMFLMSLSTVAFAQSSSPIPGMHKGDTITKYNVTGGTQVYTDTHGNHTTVHSTGLDRIKEYYTSDGHHGQIYEPFKDRTPEPSAPAAPPFPKLTPCDFEKTGKVYC